MGSLALPLCCSWAQTGAGVFHAGNFNSSIGYFLLKVHPCLNKSMGKSLAGLEQMFPLTRVTSGSMELGTGLCSPVPVAAAGQGSQAYCQQLLATGVWDLLPLPGGLSACCFPAL